MSFPYATSNLGLIDVIKQLRSSFPKSVNSDTLKKWGLAPNNERYIISTLIFLKIINEDFSKNDESNDVFLKHEDGEFFQSFSELVKEAYNELFELHGEGAWKLEKEKLISFFRQTDKTSEIIGKRQASTFQALAQYCGNEPPVKPRSSVSKPQRKPKKNLSEDTTKQTISTEVQQPSSILPQPPSNANPIYDNKGINLTVRVEINLPVTADQSIYDHIFQSIRNNLLKDESTH